jgi:hypothetical protein
MTFSRCVEMKVVLLIRHQYGHDRLDVVSRRQDR